MEHGQQNSGQDINTLEAGPELDALVAEKVMGWMRNAQYGGWYTMPGYIARAPKFSTHIADAWQVVERIHEPGRTDFSLHAATVGWSSRLGYGSKLVYADTAPLAICRAALKYVRSLATATTPGSGTQGEPR